MTRYLPLLLLVACATPAQRAAQYPSTVLCYATVAGTPQESATAKQELAQRGHACSQQDVAMGERQWAQYQSNEASRRAASGAAAAILLKPPSSPTATCTTQQVGGGRTETVCR